MSFFRSEDHLSRWLAQKGHQRGEVLTLPKVWELAKAWYADPRATGWHPRTKAQSQKVLTSVGLTGKFWQMG